MLVSRAAGFLPDLFARGKRPRPQRHQEGVRVHRTRAEARGCGEGLPLDVQTWRRCRLVEAGFPVQVAEVVAADPRFDLHALLELVDRGCPPSLAVRIVAPIAREETP